MQIGKIIELLIREFPEAEVKSLENCSPAGFEISVNHLYSAMKVLHTHQELYFDMLSCLTGIDNGTEVNTMEVLYHLFSIPYEQKITVKVTLPREKPQVSSVSSIWKTANWHEREAYDLFGISFENHPDLRRILLPDDWIGYPLRKDYSMVGTYHGLSIPFDRKDVATEQIGDLIFPDAVTYE